MDVLAGVDIGNRTTEIALATPDGRFVASAMAPTTGIKGTPANAAGVLQALDMALPRLTGGGHVLREILLCESAPVAFSATVVPREDARFLSSNVLAHNPDTPGGAGAASGVSLRVPEVVAERIPEGEPIIVLVDGSWGFDAAADAINAAAERGVPVVGIVLERDEGVLVWNRLRRKVPVLDEVGRLSRIPPGARAAIEVAPEGAACTALTDPFRLAEMLDFPEVARLASVGASLTGLRSAVVVLERPEDVPEPGVLVLTSADGSECRVRLDEGAAGINLAVGPLVPLRGISMDYGGEALDPFPQLRRVFGGQRRPLVRDVFAVDARYAAEGAQGALRMGGIGLAASVSDTKRQFGELAVALRQALDCQVTVLGRESDHMMRGALTTPRARPPLLAIDIGAGSLDLVVHDGVALQRVELTGAGDLVDEILSQTLGIRDAGLVEALKIHPVARVERRGIARLAGGAAVSDPRVDSARLVGRTVVLGPDTVMELPADMDPSSVQRERSRCKREVIVENLVRGLKELRLPARGMQVLLVGGGALDDELAVEVVRTLVPMGAAVGRANVRGQEGPRNCVATGMVLSRLAELT